MPSRSTESSAETGQLPLAARSNPEPASCRSLLLGISAGCPEGKHQVECKVATQNELKSKDPFIS